MVQSSDDGYGYTLEMDALKDDARVVTWKSDAHTLMSQYFAAGGTAVGDPVAVDTATDTIYGFTTTALETGGWVTLWHTDDDAFGRVFDADGAPAGQVFTLSNPGPNNWKNTITATALDIGGFVATWIDSEGGPTRVDMRTYDHQHLTSPKTTWAPRSA